MSPKSLKRLNSCSLLLWWSNEFLISVCTLNPIFRQGLRVLSDLPGFFLNVFIVVLYISQNQNRNLYRLCTSIRNCGCPPIQWKKSKFQVRIAHLLLKKHSYLKHTRRNNNILYNRIDKNRDSNTVVKITGNKFGNCCRYARFIECGHDYGWKVEEFPLICPFILCYFHFSLYSSLHCSVAFSHITLL